MPQHNTNDDYGFVAETMAVIGAIKAGASALDGVIKTLSPQTRRVRRASDPAARKSSAGPANPNATVMFQGKPVTVNWIVTQLSQSTTLLERVTKDLKSIRGKLKRSVAKNRRLTKRVDDLEDQRIIAGAASGILGLLIGFYAGGRNTSNKLLAGKKR